MSRLRRFIFRWFGLGKRAAAVAKLGRNEKCYCGSGRRYKRCCLRRDLAADTQRVLSDGWTADNRYPEVKGRYSAAARGFDRASLPGLALFGRRKHRRK